MHLKREAHLGFDFKHYSHAIGRSKRARVIFPREDPPDGGWRVCFLLHAFGGNRMSWLQKDARLVERLAKKCVLVFPESGRRWFIDDASGYMYEKYLIEDLLPALYQKCSKHVTEDGAVIGGFSMGGAAAVYIALRHSHLFASAYSYGGAFFASRRTGDPYETVRSDHCMMPTEAEHNRVWGMPESKTRRIYDPITIVRAALKDSQHPNIVLEVGIHDYPRVVKQNRRMHSVLRAAGLTHTYHEVPGDHSWSCAVRSSERCFSALIGRQVASSRPLSSL